MPSMCCAACFAPITQGTLAVQAEGSLIHRDCYGPYRAFIARNRRLRSEHPGPDDPV